MPQTKTFDCVQMKREIQEQIYEETKRMSLRDRLEYLNRMAAESRHGRTSENDSTGTVNDDDGEDV